MPRQKNRSSLLLLSVVAVATSAAMTTTWGSKSWNWGVGVGGAHDAAATLRSNLQSKESRVAFVQALKRCAADFEDAKLCLALVWQRGARKPGGLAAPFQEGYEKLVAGAFEDSGGDVAFATTIAPAIERYCLNVKLQVKPDRIEEFEATIRQNERGTRTEPRNLRYSYGKGTEGQGSYLFQEVFVGEQGFKEHAAAPHFAKWETFAATEPFAADPVVDFWVATTNFADEAPPSVVAAAALLSLNFVDDGWYN